MVAPSLPLPLISCAETALVLCTAVLSARYGATPRADNVAGPLSVTSHEVSCYGTGDERVPPGEPNHMPLNDVWEVLVHDVPGTPLLAATSSFQLRHRETGAYLHTTAKILPDWGFQQLEVVSSREDGEQPTRCRWPHALPEHHTVQAASRLVIASRLAGVSHGAGSITRCRQHYALLAAPLHTALPRKSTP